MLNIISNVCSTKRVSLFVFISILSITLLGQLDAVAQDDANNQCVKNCSKTALRGITECKNVSKKCVRDNSDNFLHVLDYCTDSHLSTCESTVNGNYQTCISQVCGMNVTEARSQDAFDPDDPSPVPSCSTGGDKLLDVVLDEMVVLANDEWEQAACDFGLCPLTPVYDGTINLGCGGPLSVFLDAACVLEDPAVPVCDSFWVDVDATSLNGLQFGEYEDFSVTEVNGASGTQACPNSSTANDGLDFTCSYSGTGTGSGSLKMESITMVVDSFAVKLKCSDGVFKSTHTLYASSATCSTSNPTATAQYALCGGSCDQGGEQGGVVTYLQIPKASDLELDLGSSFECVFAAPPDMPVSSFLDDFLNEFVPLFRSQIADALKEPLQETLNSIIPGLPFPPSTCQEGS